jgi:hypothetical protein
MVKKLGFIAGLGVGYLLGGSRLVTHVVYLAIIAILIAVKLR